MRRRASSNDKRDMCFPLQPKGKNASEPLGRWWAKPPTFVKVFPGPPGPAGPRTYTQKFRPDCFQVHRKTKHTHYTPGIPGRSQTGTIGFQGKVTIRTVPRGPTPGARGGPRTAGFWVYRPPPIGPSSFRMGLGCGTLLERQGWIRVLLGWRAGAMGVAMCMYIVGPMDRLAS